LEKEKEILNKILNDLEEQLRVLKEEELEKLKFMEEQKKLLKKMSLYSLGTRIEITQLKGI